MIPRTEAFGVGIEQHFRCEWAPGAMCHLARRYGTTRLWAAADMEAEGFGWQARFVGIVGNEVHAPFWVEFEVVKYLRNWPDLYFRGYGGQDPYNIRFEDSVSRIEVGFSFTWEALARRR